MSVKNTKKQTLRGDTLVEVLFAIGIFALVAISISTLMNSMLGKSQSALEIVMARSEIDAQAEALRFIQNSRNDEIMSTVWSSIDSIALKEDGAGYADQIVQLNNNSCQDPPYLSSNGFFINTFSLGDRVDPSDTNKNTLEKVVGRIFKTNSSINMNAQTFPRVLHTSDDTILRTNFDEIGSDVAEGIWVIAIKDAEEQYYDFYIQTCWSSIGNGSAPNTIRTIVRLKNPNKTISCSASFDPDNGTSSTVFNSTGGYSCSSHATAPSSPGPKDGREFLYWKNSKTNETVTAGGNFDMPSSGSVAWIAEYKAAEQTCTVKFMNNGTEVSKVSLIDCDGSITAPTTPTVGTGYKFTKWRLEGGTTEYTAGQSKNFKGAVDGIYTFKSVVIPVCTATFYSGAAITQRQSINNCDSSFDIRAPSGGSRTGHTFNGWTGSSNLSAGEVWHIPSGVTTPTDYSWNETWNENSYNYSTSNYHVSGDGSIFSTSSSGTLKCESAPSATIRNIYHGTRSISFTINGTAHSVNRPSNHKWKATITIDCSGSSVGFNVSSTEE